MDRSHPGAGTAAPRSDAAAQDTAARIERWLFEAAFPFWADRGRDRHGPGFVEHLTLAGEPDAVDFKRVRVQARQIFCFCQAAALGWPGDPLGVAEPAVDLLLRAAWLGPDVGWASTLTATGAVLDPTPDLYDTAFVLFALAWWHRVTGDARIAPLAHRTLDALGRHMRHPSGRGYRHRGDTRLRSLQNPHMHLTEAMLALRDATGDPRFGVEADALRDLCLDRFYDPATGTLAEEFDAAWTRQDQQRPIRLEPGHHYEWVWLLGQGLPGGAPADARARQAMRGLFGFASENGHNPRGLVLGAVGIDGRPLDGHCRLWSQAERLKACLAMETWESLDADAAIEAGVSTLFEAHLDTVPAGTWIEYRDPAMHPVADKIPSSSFYHLVLAFAEVLRRDGRRDRPCP